jgi:arsenate reductase
MSDARRVLFLCTGNSCRSQMAEGLLRQLAGERYESLSAGARPAGYVHPMAIQVMSELGVDITEAQSKHIEDFLPKNGVPPDLVISVCDSAAEECPVFPGKVDRKHWPFYDPIHAQGTEDERLQAFRAVREEIRARLETGIAAGELDS